MHRLSTGLLALVIGAAIAPSAFQQAHADSVAQVLTAKRISQQTIDLIDPQGTPGVVGTGTNTTVMPGDILTFIIRFTPVPNAATRGLGGYITDYIPRNTEVVGARLVDANGNTVPPHRGGLAQDGVGPRGVRAYPAPLQNGSISQVYADTGVFFSTDPRTARVPDGTMTGEQFITVSNGLVMIPAPTGAGQLDGLLGATAGAYAHNAWDWLHAPVFGAGSTFRVWNGTAYLTFNHAGTGNTPYGYGSPVAGPNTFYSFELSEPSPSVYETAGVVGPWQRIRTAGGEIGTGAPVTGAGSLARMGVPTDLGWNLSPDNPLPAYDPLNPTVPWTNAVRFAVGELVVGDEYFAEISLRVLDTPLDPVAGLDLNCAEVFGGDASTFTTTSGGKDNTWRYFLPSPACVVLNLQFDLDVDKLTAILGDTLTYTITLKNLSPLAQDNVVVNDYYLPADVTFVSATGGGVNAAGIVTWGLGTMAPGATQILTATLTITGASRPTLNHAVYTSTQFPSPGFRVVSFTDIEALAILDLALVALPDATAPGTTVHYTATITNVGTGSAALAGCGTPACGVTVALAAGFTPVSGSARANGAATANPVASGSGYTFSGPFASIVAGASLILEFDAQIGAGTAAGLYTSDLVVWAKDTGFGKQFETGLFDTAGVAMGMVRSNVPFIMELLVTGDVFVRGSTSEGAGATIRVSVNGNPEASVVTGEVGTWMAPVPTLFAGQHVVATAQAPGELESYPSAPAIVAGLGTSAPCNDGMDNDGDGLFDFPADPGCCSFVDNDESSPNACANRIDDDGDGDEDLFDFAFFQTCFGLRVGPDDRCVAADLDGDGSVGPGDYSILRVNFTGPS